MNFKPRHFPILALFLISIPFIKSLDQTCTPQQIHLSLGDKYHSVSTPDASSSENQAYLVWLAKDHCKYSVDVTEAKDLKMNNKHNVPVAVAESYSYDFANDLDGEFPGSYQKTSYTAVFQNLLNDTLYKYKILDSDGQLLAGPFTFSLASHEITSKPKKLNLKDANGSVYIIENIAATKEGGNTQYKTQEYGYVIDQKPGYGALSSVITESGEFKLIYQHYDSQTGQVIDTMNLIKTNTFVKRKNKTPYLLMVLGMAFGVVLVTVGLIALRRMKQNNEAEDNIPLTGDANPHGNSPLRSNRLRYARPGEKGITMVDLVLC